MTLQRQRYTDKYRNKNGISMFCSVMHVVNVDEQCCSSDKGLESMNVLCFRDFVILKDGEKKVRSTSGIISCTNQCRGLVDVAVVTNGRFKS